MNEIEPTTPAATEPPSPQATPPSQPTTPSTPEPEKAAPSTILNEPEKAAEPAKPEGAPEKYSDFTVPAAWKEQELELDPDVIAAATPVFAELGLSQAQAQRLIDFYAETSLAARDQNIKTVVDQNTAWKSELGEDPKIGPRLTEIKANVSKMYTAISQTADGRPIAGAAEAVTAFKQAMDLTGIGNNPAFVRFMDLLSQNYTEGRPVAGGKPSPGGQREPGSGPRSPAAAIWPSLPGG